MISAAGTDLVVPGPGHALLWDWSAPPVLAHQKERAKLLVVVKGRGLLLLFSCSVTSSAFATPWTVACQAPMSTGFSRQEYWSGLPFPSPGDRSDSGIELASPALAGRFFTTEKVG